MVTFFNPPLPICVVGGTCSVDSNCCDPVGGYCADGGAGLNLCCPRGYEVKDGACAETTECNPDEGCDYEPFDFDEFGSWWTDSDCITVSTACCNVGFGFGLPDYYEYVPITVY